MKKPKTTLKSNVNQGLQQSQFTLLKAVLLNLLRTTCFLWVLFLLPPALRKPCLQHFPLLSLLLFCLSQSLLQPCSCLICIYSLSLDPTPDLLASQFPIVSWDFIIAPTMLRLQGQKLQGSNYFLSRRLFFNMCFNLACMLKWKTFLIM